MKKYFLISLLSLLIISPALASFKPATLFMIDETSVVRKKVTTEEQAKKLFAQGFQLETKLGSATSTIVTPSTPGMYKNNTWNGTNAFNATTTFNGANTFIGTTTIPTNTMGNTMQAFIASSTFTGTTTPQPIYIASSTESGAGQAVLCKSNDQNKLDFYGFAVTSTSTGGTVYVHTDGVISGFTGLTPGAKYYVQDAGTIGTTVGTYEVLVGTAISATQLLIQRGKDEYMGQTTVAKNNSVSVPYLTKKILIYYGDVGNNGTSPDFSGIITLTKYGLTSANAIYITTGPNTWQTVFAWTGNILSASNNNLVGNATVYFYR